MTKEKGQIKPEEKRELKFFEDWKDYFFEQMKSNPSNCNIYDHIVSQTNRIIRTQPRDPSLDTFGETIDMMVEIDQIHIPNCPATIHKSKKS